MILSEEQRQELNGPEPARAVDPRTNAEYVLIRADLYERFRPVLETPSCPTANGDVPTGIQRSREAFLRDLPQLVSDRRLDRWWAAYQGDEQIGIAPTKSELVREVLRRCIPRDEYYVGIIRPHEPQPEEVEPRHPHHFDAP